MISSVTCESQLGYSSLLSLTDTELTDTSIQSVTTTATSQTTHPDKTPTVGKDTPAGSSQQFRHRYTR